MKPIKEMIAQRGDILNQYRLISDTAVKEDRDLNDEERGQADELLGRVEKLDADIERAQKFDAIEARQFAKSEGQKVVDDMTEKEKRSYSIMNVIRALSNQKPVEGIEREISDEIAKRSGSEPRGIYLPDTMIHRAKAEKRDLTAGGSTSGAEFVFDEDGNDFISALRSKLIVAGLGARVINGLVGPVAIPKISTGASASWVAEGNAPSESTQTTGSVTLSGENVTCYTQLSKQLIKQTAFDVEMMVANDLTGAIAVALDKVALEGGGSNEPSGIIDTVTVTSAAASAYSDVLDLWAAVAGNANSENYAWATNPATAAVLMATDKGSDTGRFVMDDVTMRIMAYNCAVTTNLDSDFGSGSDEGPLIFGNWSDLIVGTWGAVDMVVDPFTDSKSGLVNIVTHLLADVAVRYDESFAYSTFTL